MKKDETTPHGDCQMFAFGHKDRVILQVDKPRQITLDWIQVKGNWELRVTLGEAVEGQSSPGGTDAP
jgi:hypothetical protein